MQTQTIINELENNTLHVDKNPRTIELNKSKLSLNQNVAQKLIDKYVLKWAPVQINRNLTERELVDLQKKHKMFKIIKIVASCVTAIFGGFFLGMLFVSSVEPIKNQVYVEHFRNLMKFSGVISLIGASTGAVNEIINGQKSRLFVVIKSANFNHFLTVFKLNEQKHDITISTLHIIYKQWRDRIFFLYNVNKNNTQNTPELHRRLTTIN